MFLLEILAALAIHHFWRSPQPVHRQRWFLRWVRYFDQWPVFSRHFYLQGAVVVLLPSMAVAVVIANVHGVLAFLLATVVLVVCIGRGELAGCVDAYRLACVERDWPRAARIAERVGVAETALVEQDWPVLHDARLPALAYRGFERLFAVVFWFVFLGPLGAMVYRLSQAFTQFHSSEVARHWLWALEWLPVRLLSGSFAVTGNFVGCVNSWRRLMADTAYSSGEVLKRCALGASAIDDELVHACDVTEREITALRSLYSRTLGLWLAVLGLWVIFGSATIFR